MAFRNTSLRVSSSLLLLVYFLTTFGSFTDCVLGQLPREIHPHYSLNFVAADGVHASTCSGPGSLGHKLSPY